VLRAHCLPASRSHRLRTVASWSLAVALALGVAGLVGKKRDEERRPPVSSGESSERVHPLALTLGGKFTLGPGPSDAGTSERDVELLVRGRLRFSRPEVDSARCELVRLTDATAEDGSGEKRPLPGAECLERGYRVERDSNGGLAGVRFPAACAASARRLALRLSSLVSSVLRPEREWSARETLALGPVDVRYRALPEPGGRRVRRSWSHAARGDSPLAAQAELELTLDGSGELAGVRGEEVRTTFAGGRVVSRAVLEVELGGAEIRALAPEERERQRGLCAELGRLPQVPADTKIEADAAERAVVLRGVLGAATRDQLVAELRAATSLPRDRADARSVERLRALLLLDTGSLEPVWTELARAPASSAALLIGANALVLAGSEGAERALVRLLRHREAEVPVATLLLGLVVLLERPSSELEAYLTELAFERPGALVEGALLALGDVAARTAASEPERASRIRGRLDRALGATPAESRAGLALIDALGNAGGPPAPALVLLAKHRMPTVRARVAHALRNALDAEALLDELRRDPDPDVRAAARRAGGAEANE